MTFFCFFGLMNLAFDTTDEGVDLCLEAAGGEGVSQSCLVPGCFLFGDFFVMMAGR